MERLGQLHTAVEQMLLFDLRRAAQSRHSKDNRNEEGVAKLEEATFFLVRFSLLYVLFT